MNLNNPKIETYTPVKLNMFICENTVLFDGMLIILFGWNYITLITIIFIGTMRQKGNDCSNAGG